MLLEISSLTLDPASALIWAMLPFHRWYFVVSVRALYCDCCHHRCPIAYDVYVLLRRSFSGFFCLDNTVTDLCALTHKFHLRSCVPLEFFCNKSQTINVSNQITLRTFTIIHAALYLLLLLFNVIDHCPMLCLQR